MDLLCILKDLEVSLLGKKFWMWIKENKKGFKMRIMRVMVKIFWKVCLKKIKILILNEMGKMLMCLLSNLVIWVLVYIN